MGRDGLRCVEGPMGGEVVLLGGRHRALRTYLDDHYLFSHTSYPSSCGSALLLTPSDRPSLTSILWDGLRGVGGEAGSIACPGPVDASVERIGVGVVVRGQEMCELPFRAAVRVLRCCGASCPVHDHHLVELGVPSTSAPTGPFGVPRSLDAMALAPRSRTINDRDPADLNRPPFADSRGHCRQYPAVKFRERPYHHPVPSSQPETTTPSHPPLLITMQPNGSPAPEDIALAALTNICRPFFIHPSATSIEGGRCPCQAYQDGTLPNLRSKSKRATLCSLL
ncbi:hypothetical protein BD410DRAFT_846005 [Rickenella mellea]|uniref:Uncharacterized protein n=1 Tax=Rickenella mellea TaxID=50990 RepID=A0A4Y7PHG8_9AGAM|nr:hypothetical protein BD410DRAFT_846005 [Rickenella mellea]